MTTQTTTADPAVATSASGLSVSQGTAVSIGAVLGTGVIALPALAAGVAGPASLLAWLALILLSIPLATSFAALGARFPDAGGVSTYARKAFGPKAAAVVGWSFYFAVPVGAPPAALFGSAYVAAAFGGGRATMFGTAIALIAVVALTNAGGVKVSGKVQLGLAILLAVLLVTATAASLPHAHWSNLRPFAPHGWAAIGPAAAVLVWGFAGWEAVTSLAGDFRNPKRDVPRATAIALVVVGVLYFGVAAASVLVLGSGAGSTGAPLSELLATGFGGPTRKITAIVALVMTLGTMNAYFASSSKLGAALGRDGALPAWFAHGSISGEVPRRSLAVGTAMASTSLAVVYFGGLSIKGAVLLTTGAFTLVYLIGMLAALKLLPRHTWARRGSVVALIAVIGLMVLTGLHVLWALCIGASSLLYVRRRRVNPAATNVSATNASAPNASAPNASAPNASAPNASATKGTVTYGTATSGAADARATPATSDSDSRFHRDRR